MSLLSSPLKQFNLIQYSGDESIKITATNDQTDFIKKGYFTLSC